jgi:transmembrane sensor
MTLSASLGVTYTEAQRRVAADWFVVIHGEHEPNAESLQAWLRWMEEDEGNRLAFEAVAHAWHATPGSLAEALPSADELRVDTYDGDQPVEDWLSHQSATNELSARNANRKLSRTGGVRRLAWLAAASLAAATVGLMTMHRNLYLQSPQLDEFATKTGEHLEITLADGSRVWLGPRSKLLVSFTNERRSIQLPVGEAYFSVMKNRSRPFVVHSSSGDITAVGTAFNVRTAADHVTVAVSEGFVTVAPRGQSRASEPASARVASGQQVTFTAQEAVKALAITQSPALGERARWRDGVLVYRDEPLRDVVLDVARYSDKQLEIVAGPVGDLHYSGVVYQSAIDEWISALPESFPVKVVKEGTREIIEAH